MTRPPVLRIHEDEIVVDNFAGGGGASVGIEWAIGRSPDIAINHDPEAIAMHKANHPETRHYVADVFDVNPLEACRGKRVGLAWFSPDCTYFSKARGAKPFRDRNKARKRRGLAGVVLKWAAQVAPRVIAMENVEEFQYWGPLDKHGRIDELKRGFNFRRFVARLENLGYKWKIWILRACDYGAPTTRRRLFLLARNDGNEIVCPAPSHAAKGDMFLKPYRTAADCIDWSIPCPSIFMTKEEARAWTQQTGVTIKRPLSEKTLKRIAAGVKRYVLDSAKPFIVQVAHGVGGFDGEGLGRTHAIDEPVKTITGSRRGTHAVVTPFISRLGQQGGNGNYVNDAEDPLTTVTTKAEHLLVTPFTVPVKTWGGGGNEPRSVEEPMRTTTTSKRGEHALVVPALIQTSWGERQEKDGCKEQAPRVLNLHAPLGTVMGGGIKHSVVAAFLAKHFGDKGQRPGSAMDEPVATITSVDHHSLVAAHIVNLKGSMDDRQVSGSEADQPIGTITAQGTHWAEVRAFLYKYYGTQQDPRLEDPMHTLTTKDRMALVTVMIGGEEYAIVDIGMRMLTPRELFRAQGFPDDYVIDPVVERVESLAPWRRPKKTKNIPPKTLTKTAQVRMCGNSVCPPAVQALLVSNLPPITAAAKEKIA